MWYVLFVPWFLAHPAAIAPASMQRRNETPAESVLSILPPIQNLHVGSIRPERQGA